VQVGGGGPVYASTEIREASIAAKHDRSEALHGRPTAAPKGIACRTTMLSGGRRPKTAQVGISK